MQFNLILKTPEKAMAFLFYLVTLNFHAFLTLNEYIEMSYY